MVSVGAELITMLKVRLVPPTRRLVTLVEAFRILQRSAAMLVGSNRAVGTPFGIFIEGTECEMSILLRTVCLLVIKIMMMTKI